MGCFSRINFLKAENKAEQTTQMQSNETIFYQAIEFYLDSDNDQELIYFQIFTFKSWRGFTKIVTKLR